MVATVEALLKRLFLELGSTLKVQMDLSSVGRCTNLHSVWAISGPGLAFDVRAAIGVWGRRILKRFLNRVIFSSNVSCTFLRNNF